MITPKISLYITSYNYEAYIEAAIQSALGQTFEPFELIIIDDGSTDGSRSIIEKYTTHPKVRVIYQKNMGLNATNNVALKASRGEYIMRLDADDFLDENALMVMHQAIEKDKHVAMVFPDYYYVDHEGMVTGQERRHDFDKEVSLYDSPAHGACSLIRKEILIEVGAYSDGYTCQDGYDLWLKLIENYGVKNVQLPLFYYRRHNANLTNNNERILRTRAQIMADHADRANKPDLSVIAVLPVRGSQYDPQCMSMRKLGDRSMISWTIDSVLASKKVKELIVTSPDELLLSELEVAYGDKLTLFKRGGQDASESKTYFDAINHTLKYRKSDDNFDAVFVVTVDAPFRDTLYIDKGVNAMRVYDVDTVIGVTAESDQFFRHLGGGLEAVRNNTNDSELRLERDYLFRQTGGFVLTRKEFIMDGIDPYSGTVGHVVLTKKAGLKVLDEIDLKLAHSLLGD